MLDKRGGASMKAVVETRRVSCRRARRWRRLGEVRTILMRSDADGRS
jgi:hypothetical protein